MRTRKHEDRKFCSQHILLTISPKKRNVKTNHGPVSYFMWLPACSHTFCMLIAELSRARSARTGAPWVRKFAFQAKKRRIKQQQSRVFPSTRFEFLHWVIEKELERERDKKRRWPVSLEEKHENFKAAVRKWEMLTARKVRISGSEE